MNSKIWTVISALIIGFLGGVGSVHLTIASEVRTHTVQIGNLNEKVSANAATVEKRMEYVVRLLESNAKASGDMIALVREQNQLIERFYLKNQ
jgi:hypothetical protein